VHGATKAAWFTVNDWFAIETVPLRAPPVFAAMPRPIEPLPVPDAPEVTVIHGAPLDAVHAQAVAVVIVTVAVLAPAPTF
jgi:hypothetical protein